MNFRKVVFHHLNGIEIPHVSRPAYREFHGRNLGHHVLRKRLVYAVAAKQEGRHYIGYEIDKGYYETAKERVSALGCAECYSHLRNK